MRPQTAGNPLSPMRRRSKDPPSAIYSREYLVTALPAVSKDELPHEQAPIVELEDTATVLESLHTTDWSFTDDDTRYLTHDLHPYPAKFIPQIPARLIAQLSAHGDTVLDPFGGSATTAVEAVRLGRRAISFDANPLSALIGRVKTGFMTPRTRADIEQLYAAVEGHITCYSSSTANWAESLTARNRKYLPDIPNIRKWFNQDAIAELCLLRHLIEQTTDGLSQDAALLALSRIIIRVSYQESETRYVSVKKDVVPTLVLRAYCESLRTVSRRLESAAQNLQFADARFFVGDSRSRLESAIGENSIDLIVTSPPYPNATDYHLYHRFRLFWLGYDPKELSKIEIGSHLRHQRNHTGFEEYCEDMDQAMYGCAKVLMPGRYAVFVVGDAIFKGELFSTSEAIRTSAEDSGLIVCSTIERQIHNTKRSFATPARRARTEQIVIFRKPNAPVTVRLFPPNYRMWDYERLLRAREIESLTGCSTLDPCAESPIVLRLEQPAVWRLRQLTFTQFYSLGDDRKSIQETWQKVIENGDLDPASRKDPKYVTHGLHAFKGKFYPQLAKSLLNISGAQVGSKLLDPFCGSGTTLLEGMLNGYHGFGCDLNPLAAKMSQAKTGVLSLSREVVDSAIRSVLDKLSARESRFVESLDQFSRSNHGELFDWFPLPVLYKLNWLLAQLRLFGNRTLVDFFEVIVSGLLRDVSYQDPSDLRIRRRKDKLGRRTGN